METLRRLWGRMPDGRDIYETVLIGDGGLKAAILDLGGILQKLDIPDADGVLADVVPGPATVEDVLYGRAISDSTLGRHANRIGGARMEIDGKVYELERNDGDNNLHSASGCYSGKLFLANPWVDAYGAHVRLCYSDSGEGNFPGSVQAEVTYTLEAGGRLQIEFSAVPSARTPINMTNHAYFNVAGMDSGTIEDQFIRVNADFYMPNGEGNLQNGEIRMVDNTAFDLRRYTRIGDLLKSDDPQIRNSRGLDHCFCIRGRGMREAAAIADVKTGRGMRVYADTVGIQVFTDNLVASSGGKNKKPYPMHAACCFEAQSLPNSLMYPHLKDCVYGPGEKFHSKVIYEFGHVDENVIRGNHQTASNFAVS